MTATPETVRTDPAGRLAEIRDRDEAATAGPWGTEYDGNGTYYVHARLRTTPHEGMASDGVVAELKGEHGDGVTYRNARFIAHARQDVRFLQQELADTQLTRDFHQNSARHLADKRDVAEEVLSEWEAGKLSPETALKMIRSALAVGEVKTFGQLRKETPDDPRFQRRIYVDGEGDPWIEIPMVPDDGRVAIVQLREDIDRAVDSEEIRENTGGLREIGRCA